MVGGVLHTRALFFCSCYLWSQQDVIDKSGFLGSLVGAVNERLRHAWGTLIDKIDGLIRGTKSAGRKARLPHYDERARLFSLYARRTTKKRQGLLALTSLMKTGPGLEGLLAYPGWRKATTTHRPGFSVELGGWMMVCWSSHKMHSTREDGP